MDKQIPDTTDDLHTEELRRHCQTVEQTFKGQDIGFLDDFHLARTEPTTIDV